MAPRKLREQGEIRRRLDFRRGDAHQPDDRQSGRPGRFEQRRKIGYGAAAFLGFVADIDLEEAVGTATARPHRFGERGDQRRPVDRVDDVEQTDSLLGLVRLERADQMEPKILVTLTKRRPFRRRFLDPILSEMAMPRLDQRFDRRHRMGLRHGDQGDVAGRPPSQPGGSGDGAFYLFE